MYQKSLLNILVISIGYITILVGCTKHSSQSHPVGLIRIDIGSEVPTLDPALAEDTASTRISWDLFAGLVDFDQGNKIIPGMAEKWDISPDGKTYTFYLRPNLKFSDGSPITASDFVYSWRRLVNPSLASPYNTILANVVGAQAIMDNRAPLTGLGVTAPTPNTFIVKLVNPDPSFIQAIHLPNVAVVSQKAIKKYGNSWTEPGKIVTSGAYVVKEHIINGYILAQKNLNYYDAANVRINQVKYLPYEDKNATLPTYRSAGLDITFQSLPIDQYAQIKREYNQDLHVIMQEANYYYDFNANNPELANNPKLRQALSMAIDRKILVEKVLRQGQPALYSPVTHTIENGRFAAVNYAWADWSRDKQIAEAKKLYTEAGYGPDHPFQAALSYNTNHLHKKVALAVAAMWKDVLGIDTTLQNQEWKTFLQSRHKGDYQIARDGWVADYDSVLTYIALYQCNNPHNNSHYCNPAFDKLVAKANMETNPSKQTELYAQALQLPLNDYATIPLFQYTIQVLVKPHVQNYSPEINHLYHTQTKWLSIDALT